MKALLTLMLVTTAAWQEPESSKADRVPRWTEAKGTGQNFEILFHQGFGRCVATYGRAYGEALVSTNPYSEAAIAAGKEIGARAGTCLARGSARLSAERARGAIAEALLKTADKMPLTGSSPFAPGETFASFMGKFVPGAEKAPASVVPAPIVARWTAICAARENSAAVSDLLLTQQGSRKELQSLDRLNPTLSSCLPGEQVLTTNVRSFRAYLAEALYWQRAAERSSNAKS
jgi:hypothetical protein